MRNSERRLRRELISFLISSFCRAVWSLKLCCREASRYWWYFNSKASNLAARSVFHVEAYTVVLLLIKPFIASQSILGSETEQTLNSKNSLKFVSNWVLNVSSRSKEELKRHLGALVEDERTVTEQYIGLWSDQVNGMKCTFWIFWNRSFEAKIKSNLEKDLCLPE